ncbi:MAG: Ig-like domain-containing protein, partial [Desulfobulbaceae bacterium]|nr:Ig-like domain-containing protein [Desulfobulbaceae bacterium]
HRKVVNACATCHAVATTTAVDTLHKACTTCHGYTGTKLNPTTVANAINTGKGTNGTDISCQTCHTAGHNTDTDHNHRKITASCSPCHSAGSATQVDTLHKTCTSCHSSTKTAVVNAISTGKGANGADVSCTTCHSSGTDSALTHGTTNTTVATMHDKFNMSATCSGCHVSGTAVQRLALHPACTTCHGYTGTKLNATTVANAITTGKGANGADVNCQTCHTSGHNTDTDHNHRKSVTSCATCHAIGTATAVDTLHKACTTCHGYTGTKLNPTTVANAITTGKGANGADVNCQTCHTPGHVSATDHNHRKPVTGCANCHDTETATAVDTLHKACTTCHGYTGTKLNPATVANAITTGKGANGTDVNCKTCHTANAASFHHTNAKAVAGKCTWCHADPRSSWTTMRPGDNGSTAPFPTQMACRTCHVRVSGSTIYIDKISYNMGSTYPYSTAPTRTVQHTLTGITAGSINNFGICMSCHDGTKAVGVGLFHAKPTTPASRNRQDNMKYAPGVGTFNLFWNSWHGREDASFGREEYENSQNKWRNPTVSFKYIAAPCASFNNCSGATTKLVPVLPAVANATDVNPISNLAPIANNDTYPISSGTSNNMLDVLINDTDPNNDTLIISVVGSTSNGGTVTNNTTSLSYTPAPGFIGTETFTYTAKDPGELSSTTTVTVTVEKSSVQRLNPYDSLSSGTSATLIAKSGPNRLLLVAVHYEYNSNKIPSSVTVTYGGKNLTQISKSANQRNDIWLGYLKESDIAARVGNIIAVSFPYNSSPTNYSISAATYSGVNQTAPILSSVVNQVANGGSSSTPSFSGLSVAKGGYVHYAITANSGVSFTTPTGYSSHFDINDPGNNYKYTGANKEITTTGSESATIPLSASARWGLVAAAINPSP